MSLTFVNGSIWTGTGDEAHWVRVEGRRITGVGTGDPPEGERFDLAGRTLLPGFQDAHVHPPIGGFAMMRCELHDVEPTRYHSVIASYAAAHPKRPWIIGGGWPMNAFSGGIARREPLDQLVPDRPVLLYSAEGHAAWVNSRALEVAGITSETPDPIDGRIERDSSGEPTGTLQEGAIDLVERAAPDPTVEDMVEAISRAQAYLLSFGITSWQDAWVREVDHEAYRALDASGDLIASVTGSMWWDRSRGVEQLDELLAMLEDRGDRYRPVGIKLMVDGVVENATGSVCDPYLDTGDRGLTFLPRELLMDVVPRMMAAGAQPHFHAIGDCAIRSALDAVEAGNPHDVLATRPHIAHIHLIDPADVPRFGSLGVVANAQTLWACRDDTMVDLTIPRLGPERSRWQYPFRSLIDHGARVAAGSDWSVSTPNPFEQMAVAVTRRGTDDREPLLIDEAITVEEALTAFTAGSAWVNHRVDRSGTIEDGKDADLVVTSDDPRTVSDLRTVSVEATFVGGRTVHER